MNQRRSGSTCAIEQLSDISDDPRDVIYRGVPHRLWIDRIVFMREPVAHTHHLPRIGKSRLDSGINLERAIQTLAYQLEQALYRQESHPLEIVIAAVLPPSKQNDLVAKLEKVE